MWFPGHTALGLALAAGVLALASRRSAAPTVFALAPFFANLIDFFHLDLTRPWSHNLIAAVAIPIVALLVWRRWTRWPPAVAAALLAASTAAVIGDLVFSELYPFGPISWVPVGWFPFNARDDLAVEAIAGVGLLVLYLPARRRIFDSEALRGFAGPWWISPAMAAFLVAILFWGECGVYVALHFAIAGDFSPLAVVDAAVFVAAALAYTRWFAASGGAWLRDRALAALA